MFVTLKNFEDRNNSEFKLFETKDDLITYYYGIKHDNIDITIPILYDILKNKFSLYALNKLAKPEMFSEYMDMSTNKWENLFQKRLLGDFVLSLPFFNILELKGNYLISDILTLDDNGNLVVNKLERISFYLAREFHNEPDMIIDYIDNYIKNAGNLETYVMLFIIHAFMKQSLLKVSYKRNPKFNILYKQLNSILTNKKAVIFNNYLFCKRSLEEDYYSFSHLSLFKIHNLQKFDDFIINMRQNGKLEKLLNYLRISLTVL